MTDSIRKIDDRTLEFNGQRHRFTFNIASFSHEDDRVVVTYDRILHGYSLANIVAYDSRRFHERWGGYYFVYATLFVGSTLHVVPGTLDALIVNDVTIRADHFFSALVELEDGIAAITGGEAFNNTNVFKVNRSGERVWQLEKRDDLGAGSYAYLQMTTDGRLITSRDRGSFLNLDPHTGAILDVYPPNATPPMIW